MTDELDEFIKGMRWQNENAYGATLDDVEVAFVVGMADEITRLRAQVAAAYEDAANAIQERGVGELAASGHDDHAFFVATYGRDIARARTPDDAAAALDDLLEKAVKAALEEAALYAEDGFCCRRCGTAFVGRVGHYDEDCPYNDAHWNSLDDEHRADAIRAIDPAAIVQKVKAKTPG